MNSKTTPHERCNSCEKWLPKSELKQCSGCHLIKYCSRDCQKAAWPRHKRSCAGTAKARQEFLHSGDPVAADKYTTITKWAACWQEGITMLGMCGMDLANHPEDRLITHVVFLQVEFREPRPLERARWLRMCTGSIIPRNTLIAIVKETSIDPASLVPLEATGAPDVLQIVLICDDMMRSFKCGLSDVGKWRDADKALSSARAQRWEDVLLAKIERGEAL